VSKRPTSDALPRRIDVYLSGGGYRAALGALGVMYFLAFDGRWDDVRRIVSVSGGSIVNAHLALTRPMTSDVPSELSRLFETLTSRRHSLRAFFPALGALVVGTFAVIVTVYALSHSSGWTVLVAAAWLPIGLFYAIRLWLWLLYRSVVGTAYLDDLANSDWTIEHVFVATDLGRYGSVFFVANAIQPQVAASSSGYFDGRDVAFTKVLRATTALPPILPPTRMVLRSKPRRRNSPFASREYLWKPERAGHAVKMWLADGGVTGNLGIQLDSTLAPDNLALLEFTMSHTMSGTPATRTAYTCRWHDDQIAWNCCACHQETVVVDASGTTRRTSRLAERMLGVPVLSLPFLAVRSLQVMYGSSLADDQAHGGDVLVGVVSTDQMIKRIAMRNRPLSRSTSSIERMFAAGEFLQFSKDLAKPALQGTLGMSRLLRACYAARTATSKLATRLSAVRAPVAAQVVASGYLNACLNAYGPHALDHADQGMRWLAELLGPEAALDDWWNETLRSMSAS
jgi:predicted acylesterase/phospholipase RssA